MTLALTLTLALFALYVWTTTKQGRWIALAGVMTGLAALTKGPVALVLIGTQTIAYLCLTRQAKRLLSPALWGGFALCLIVALPWFLAMIRLHGQLFIDGFLEANNVTRYLQAEHQSTSPFWFFLPVLLAGFFPWSLALPGALILAWRQGREDWRKRLKVSPTLFLGLWIALVFVFFSASQSKLITYIFPLYPAAAVLVGYWLAKQSEKQKAKSASRRETLSFFAPLWIYAVLFMTALAFLFRVQAKYGIAPQTMSLWGVVAITTIPACLIAPRPWAAPGLGIVWFLLIAWCSPTWKTREVDVSERKMAVAADAAVLPGSSIYALGLKHPSLRFYADAPVVYTDDHAAAARDILAHPGVVYATRPEVLDDLRQKYGVTNYEIVQRYARTVLIRAKPRPPSPQ